MADIFRLYGPGYRKGRRLPRQQLRVMRAIETCRTSALGRHVERCGHCQYQRISYNSCRNRHCPKCQNAARAEWSILFDSSARTLETLVSEFRRLFLDALEVAFSLGKLYFYGDLAPALDRFPQLLTELGNLEWVVYAKPPFGGPQQVIDYLGRYTHRVAISNQRLRDIDNDHVSFDYKDYRSGDRYKTRRMRLPADEFMRRFLLHTLPPGFQRIRHYGLLASRNKMHNLLLCRRLLDVATDLLSSPAQIAECVRDLLSSVGPCPACGVGQMIRIERIS